MDGKAFAFAQIQNTGDPTMVSFVCEYDKTHYATIPVNVGASPGWRTWSTAKLRSGNWLLDANGEVLLEKAFTVEPNSTGNVAMPENGMQVEMGGPADNARSDGIPASFDFLRR